MSKKTKVCLYTICKDEDHEVEGWWECAKEADYVIALDTGSSDGMDDHLERLGCEVHRKEYDGVFRFDVARNESMKYAYATDADVFVNLDMDERFHPGWADILRSEWDPSKHTRGTCSYYVSDPVKPGRRNWIHNREWHWVYPVHETLSRDDTGIWYTFDEDLNLEKKVYIQHCRKPDKKTRDQYLSLIELRWQEDKPNLDSLCYLVREYMYADQADKTLSMIDEIESLHLEGNIGSWICVFVAWAYESVNDPYRSMMWLYRGWNMDPSCRTAPVSLARLLCDDGNPFLANVILERAYELAPEWNVNCMFYDADDVWEWRMDDWMGVTFGRMGKWAEAIPWYKKALEGIKEGPWAYNHVTDNLHYAIKMVEEGDSK